MSELQHITMQMLRKWIQCSFFMIYIDEMMFFWWDFISNLILVLEMYSIWYPYKVELRIQKNKEDIKIGIFHFCFQCVMHTNTNIPIFLNYYVLIILLLIYYSKRLVEHKKKHCYHWNRYYYENHLFPRSRWLITCKLYT